MTINSEEQKVYPAYKDSGIDWIGEIPKHWEVSKMKYVSKINMGQSPSSSNYNDIGKGLPFLQGNSEFGELFPKNHIFTELITKTSKIGDILFSVRGSVGEMNWTDKIYCIGRGLCSITAYGLSSKVLWYLLISSKEEFKSISVGSTFYSVSVDDIKNFSIPYPSLTEQQQIVTFLDDKTQKIDQQIKIYEKKIKLLKEYRTALINETVTKGLNPNVKMKDSGIEWIGEIPVHWEKIKLAWAFDTIGSGTTPQSDNDSYYENGTINWLLTGDLNDGYISKTSKKITKKALELHSTLKYYPENSIVIAMYGATIGKLGLLKIKSTTNQACCVLSNSSIFEIKYVFYWLFASRKDIIRQSYGGGQPNISQDTIRNLKISLPHLPEQQQIVDFLDKKTAAIDKEMEITEKKLKLMKEYRQALISEVVTGKIMVTNENEVQRV